MFKLDEVSNLFEIPKNARIRFLRDLKIVWIKVEDFQTKKTDDKSLYHIELLKNENPRMDQTGRTGNQHGT